MLQRLFPVVLLLLSFSTSAQDSLFHVNGTIAVGTVEEIGLKTVRYRTLSGSNSVQVTLEKEELARIKLQNGQEFLISAMPNPTADERFMARKNCVSFDVLAPALNHFTLGYERHLGRQMNFQLKLGYIGLARTDRYNQLFNSQGWLMKLGVKLRLPTSPKRIAAGRTKHGLAGWYIRPEFMVSSWLQEQHYYSYFLDEQTGTMQYTSGAFVVNFGNQWLIGERITFDIYSGLGYGVQWRQGSALGASDYYFNGEPYSFSHSFLGSGTPLVFTGGMMFGFVF
ncbi:MAG: hypothetical protein JNM49_04880 [Flavobacteriales bacterium]|nr:hypothetical protein [Flavobacteriales bacterium]